MLEDCCGTTTYVCAAGMGGGISSGMGKRLSQQGRSVWCAGCFFGASFLLAVLSSSLYLLLAGWPIP